MAGLAARHGEVAVRHRQRALRGGVAPAAVRCLPFHGVRDADPAGLAVARAAVAHVEAGVRGREPGSLVALHAVGLVACDPMGDGGCGGGRACDDGVLGRDRPGERAGGGDQHDEDQADDRGDDVLRHLITSDHVEAFGVHAVARDADLRQRLLHRVHERVRPADEVLEAPEEALRQMPLQDVRVDVAALAGPVVAGPGEHAHDGEAVHVPVQLGELLVVREIGLVGDAVEQHDGAHVPAPPRPGPSSAAA